MNLKKYIATISYIGMILFLNTLFVSLPGVAAFGQSFSLADAFVGCIYIVRDFAQREIKHWILPAMLVGTLLSYFLADKSIALASAGAFAVGELIDWSLFTLTKKPLSKRLLISALLSAPVDSYVFLLIAERLHWLEFTIMTLGKFAGVMFLWLCWKRSSTNKAQQITPAT